LEKEKGQVFPDIVMLFITGFFWAWPYHSLNSKNRQWENLQGILAKLSPRDRVE
jgi:hypothetical protein